MKSLLLTFLLTFSAVAGASTLEVFRYKGGRLEKVVLSTSKNGVRIESNSNFLQEKSMVSTVGEFEGTLPQKEMDWIEFEMIGLLKSSMPQSSYNAEQSKHLAQVKINGNSIPVGSKQHRDSIRLMEKMFGKKEIRPVNVQVFELDKSNKFARGKDKKKVTCYPGVGELYSCPLKSEGMVYFQAPDKK